MATIHIKDKDDFNSKLADAGDQLVVVDFYADWCGPCKMIAPKLEELAKEFANSIVVLKVSVDECEELTVEYNISSMPTFLFIKNKEVLSQFSGANYDKLRAAILEHK
ncbi:thioredoxin-2 [Agrilus planipennis]|uniref:Thioredoxin n=1 Tax=Agrilus planipennis TaxID=224129 RepID=A0A1W4XUY2_AGRPL|nr:thioredoxin-2 [Agrilus planipennis]